MVHRTACSHLFHLLIYILTGIWRIQAQKAIISEWPNQHVSGGRLQDGLNTFASCRATCFALTWCLALDFDSTSDTCWYHGKNSICNPPSELRGTTHYKFVHCYPHRQVSGGVYRPGYFDAGACIVACSRDVNCIAVDFERQFCWFHTRANNACGATLRPSGGTMHYKLIDCNAQAPTMRSAPGNPLGVGRLVAETFHNAHIVGGTPISGVHEESACILACQGNCFSVDFDYNDRSCWHHYGQQGCRSPNAYRQRCQHFRTTRCSAPQVLNDQSSARTLRPIVHANVQSVPVPLLVQPPRVEAPPCGIPLVPSTGSRIIGGDGARPNSWPWQVALRNINASSSRCAGTLIAALWVLTTSHCVDQDPDPTKWFVLVGAHDLLQLEPRRRVHTVAQIIIHPQFDINTFNNDIALLRLTSPVAWGVGARPICLPPASMRQLTGMPCWITGWGVAVNKKRPLKQASVPVVPLNVCRRRDWLGAEFILTDNMICAGYDYGGTDTCQGDSGGPLMCYNQNHWIQIGLTSFGRGCGLPKKPGVYTRVMNYRIWVESVIGFRLP